MIFRLELREHTPRWLSPALTIAAVAVATLVTETWAAASAPPDSSVTAPVRAARSTRWR